ncbi:putative phosphoglycerate mutase [Pseudonocardia sp. Ae168_Ps1]|uniref:histidine phosphatase family protein n=1 Tax=unclassified Pseudonocardia TaxID=2619320 RepID=UPI000960540E|nr:MULTISPECIES: histidine phosphatase family protein [unclassified Pseudonocardia]OLL75176.1 putative phosphoglycerate mutase [Pseudonocardia sp. Ae150A_Ps1]OLL81170.1 putative phosphoglycerate mutase [Pseudonocardia sp. Ae168_Ps1]OLL84715.1 putative phosphoglycerate mutase [Pseudonocardia sp. Ae263_Ps1]OLL95268.1 putative phosphoglycerate mutase [Pseudonocardia sp. Ae356_Ps1]
MTAPHDGRPDDEHDGAASFAAVGVGARLPSVPPDDGAVRLVLVRHGRTPSNVRHALDTGLSGPGLDELGHEQARAVAGLLGGWPVRALYASRAVRAQETAAPIGEVLGLDVRSLPGAHEVYVGELDRRADDDAREIFDGIFEAWWDGDVTRPMPGGESVQDVWDRFLPDVSTALEPVTSGAVVVVSHGAAIRLLTLALLDGPDAQFGRDNPIPNTGRVVLRRDPGGWTRELWDPMPDRTPSSH